MIGKDIIWFHCVIWPALLLATGIPLPRTVFAHGFVNGPDGFTVLWRPAKVTRVLPVRW